MSVSKVDKSRYVEMFNDTIIEFLNDLLRVSKEDKDIKKFKTSIIMLKTVQEQKTSELFHRYVGPYYDQIRQKNDAFFKSQRDIYKTGGMTTVTGENVTDELIDKLRDMWDSLAEEDKENVWNYMLVLMRLCEKMA
jgi:hypothetical protein